MPGAKKINVKNMSEVYSETNRTSKIEFIKETTIFTMYSTLDVCAEF